MDDLLLILVAGLRTGCIYASVALGYYVIIRATSILNFAQGEWLMLAAVSGAALLGTGVPLPFVLVASIAIAALGSVLAERLIIAPLQARKAPEDVLVVALLGIMIVVRFGTGSWYGRLDAPLPSPAGSAIVVIGDSLVFTAQTLFVFAVTATLYGAFLLFTRFTWHGFCLQVTASDRLGAQLCGMDPGHVRLTAFAIAGAIAGITGWLVGPLFAAGYMMGVLPGIKGFIALIVGGVATPLGGLVGGLLLGSIEAMSSYYLSSLYSEAIAFAFLLLVLALRPQGLLGPGRETT
ncbi:MAG: branched-chain amino acid ABC transporter permease [Burkholderiaceae bacterium]|nr:branched-chain amino acid ABC transporter permease [Burkholderiaceae bacterium]